MIRLKKWIRPIAFLLILAVLLQGFSYLFIIRGNGNKNALSIMKQPENSLDYLVMGDSECYSSISPMEIWMKYGIAGYNCGVVGQHAQHTYYLMEQVLEKQSQKVVLLETNELFRSSKGSSALESAVENLVSKYFPLLQYHNGWKKISISEIRQFHPFKKQSGSDSLKGFHYRPQVVAYTGGNYMVPTDKVKPIDAIPLYYLNCMADLCEKRGAQLVLVSVPSPDNWNYKKHNAVARYAQKRGITYIDLNLSINELGIDWSKDTTDKGDHLSFTGAQKVTAYMAEWLDQNFDFEDRRNDPKYESWNKVVESYLKKTGQAKNLK